MPAGSTLSAHAEAEHVRIRPLATALPDTHTRLLVLDVPQLAHRCLHHQHRRKLSRARLN
eukprot:3940791-Rhodomonas_salina.2